MRSYEMVFIVRPDLEGDELDEAMADVQALIERNDGSLSKIEPWGLHRLAYPIHDYREGRYVLATFEMEPSHISNLERALKLRESVIRHLVVRLDS